jgi:hypothetical protein
MHQDLLLYYSIPISLRKQYESRDGASGNHFTQFDSVNR